MMDLDEEQLLVRPTEKGGPVTNAAAPSKSTTPAAAARLTPC